MAFPPLRLCAAIAGALICASACAEKPLHTQPLPALANPRTPPERAITAPNPLVIPGERLIWGVSWRGMVVGRAELAFAPALDPADRRSRIAARSRFRTLGAARELNPLTHDLATEVALHRRPDANARDPVHNLHEALAVLRAWARPGAPPGHLEVRHDGRRYRVQVASPHFEAIRDPPSRSPAIRVDCRAERSTPSGQAQPAPLYVTLWFSAEPARVPLRIDVEDDGFRAHAHLIERQVLSPR